MFSVIDVRRCFSGRHQSADKETVTLLRSSTRNLQAKSIDHSERQQQFLKSTDKLTKEMSARTRQPSTPLAKPAVPGVLTREPRSCEAH